MGGGGGYHQKEAKQKTHLNSGICVTDLSLMADMLSYTVSDLH